MTDNFEEFNDLDELVAWERSMRLQDARYDPRGQAHSTQLNPLQQQAALRALHAAGVAQNLVIDVRGDVPIVTKQPEEALPQFKPIARATFEPQSLDELNDELARLVQKYNLAERTPVQPPKQSRFSRIRERVSERLHHPMPSVRRAVGAVALAGLALVGGAITTHGNGGEALPTQQPAPVSSTAYEAQTTSITVHLPEAAPTIDLSNQATADALGRMIVSFDDIRIQMGPTANEAQIQAAQFQALDYAAALEATNA